MVQKDLTRRALLFGRKATDITEDEGGATAVEYGLMAALVSVALINSLRLLGRRQRQNYRCIKRAMRGVEQTRFCKRRGA